MWLKICIKGGGALVPDVAGDEFACVRCGSTYVPARCKNCGRRDSFVVPAKASLICRICGVMFVTNEDVIKNQRTRYIHVQRKPASVFDDDYDADDGVARRKRSVAYLLSGLLRLPGHDVAMWGHLSGLGADAIQGYLNGDRKINEGELLRLFLSLLMSEPQAEFTSHALQARHLHAMPTERGRGNRCGGLIGRDALVVLNVRYSSFVEFMRALQSAGYTTYKLERITGYGASAWAHYLSGRKQPSEETLMRAMASLLLDPKEKKLFNKWMSAIGLSLLPGPELG